MKVVWFLYIGKHNLLEIVYKILLGRFREKLKVNSLRMSHLQVTSNGWSSDVQNAVLLAESYVSKKNVSSLLSVASWPPTGSVRAAGECVIVVYYGPWWNKRRHFISQQDRDFCATSGFHCWGVSKKKEREIHSPAAIQKFLLSPLRPHPVSFLTN